MSSVQFAAATGGGKPYVLRFNDIALKFLSLSLPKGERPTCSCSAIRRARRARHSVGTATVQEGRPKQDGSNPSPPQIARPVIDTDARAATGDRTNDG